jgi:hypothetical protein
MEMQKKFCLFIAKLFESISFRHLSSFFKNSSALKDKFEVSSSDSTACNEEQALYFDYHQLQWLVSFLVRMKNVSFICHLQA